MVSPTTNKIVVLVIFNLQGGGAERFVLTLAKAFLKLGYQPHVVCFKRHMDYALPDGIHYHFLNYQAYRWLPKGSLRHRLFARRFDRYVRQHIGLPALLLSNLYSVDQVLQLQQTVQYRLCAAQHAVSRARPPRSVQTNFNQAVGPALRQPSRGRRQPGCGHGLSATYGATPQYPRHPEPD